MRGKYPRINHSTLYTDMNIGVALHEQTPAATPTHCKPWPPDVKIYSRVQCCSVELTRPIAEDPNHFATGIAHAMHICIAYVMLQIHQHRPSTHTVYESQHNTSSLFLFQDASPLHTLVRWVTSIESTTMHIIPADSRADALGG